MPSRAELRRISEWALRVLVIASLAWALWQSMRTPDAGAAARSASISSLAREVQAVTGSIIPTSLDVRADASPTQADVDLLAALRHAGIAVRWNGAVPPLALEVMRDRTPTAGARITLVGDSSHTLDIADSAGVLGKASAAAGATLDVGTVVGTVTARAGTHSARARAPSVPNTKAVLVIGRAGWESKFVLSALSESGWDVRGSLSASPTVTVRDDNITPIDTSRYDAVVVLDSTASEYSAALARFVAQGGGLVVEAQALSLDPVRSIAPSQSGERQPGRILLTEDTVTTRDLPIRPLESLRPDAVSLSREPAGVTLAARRSGLGRVLAIGYDESWRWRMLGGSTGLAAHRAFWARAVSSVSPEREVDTPSGLEAAPRAALLLTLGDSSSPLKPAVFAGDGRLPIMLLAILCVALLCEVASRRFRGVK